MQKIIFSLIIIIAGALSFYLFKINETPLPFQSHDSYSIKSDSIGKTYLVNTPSEYSFKIIDEQGNTLKNFAVTHTKLMHVIVVRKDLIHFQHIHPDFDSTTGTFILKNLTFPADGQYRIFADFAVNRIQMDATGMSMATTLFEDVSVGDMANYKPQPIGIEEKTKNFDGLQVTLNTHGILMSGVENMLMFNLFQNGKVITELEPYLGALGHAVILREDNFNFIHAHPVQDINVTQNGNVDFMVNFPEAGTYKVFTQFQRDGKVITTDFVVSVGESPLGRERNMSGMNHSMH